MCVALFLCGACLSCFDQSWEAISVESFLESPNPNQFCEEQMEKSSPQIPTDSDNSLKSRISNRIQSLNFLNNPFSSEPRDSAHTSGQSGNISMGIGWGTILLICAFIGMCCVLICVYDSKKTPIIQWKRAEIVPLKEAEESTSSEISDSESTGDLP